MRTAYERHSETSFLQSSLEESCGTRLKSFCMADAIVILVISAAALALFGKELTLGGLADPDSAAHVMDGVLIHDWVAAGPSAWTRPVEFAKQQYGHYPTLGIGRHYPPGFAAVEAIFFAAFGISTVSARLSVAFFGVLLGVGIYVFTRRFADRMTAALAGILAISMPAALLWGRQTMLEVPTAASMAWAGVLFLRYIEVPTWWRLWPALVGGLLTVLFKQTAIALLGGMALYVIVGAFAGWNNKRHAMVAGIFGIASLIGLVMSFDDGCAKTLSGYETFASRWGMDSLLYYARIMRFQTGSLVLLAGVMGTFFLARRHLRLGCFLVCWIAVGYAMLTIGTLKVPRFAFVMLPPIAICGAFGIAGLVQHAPVIRGRSLIRVCVAAGLVYVGVKQPVRHSPEFAPVVSAHVNELRHAVVLFSGLRDGDFVFAMREKLGYRNSMVIRGSKLLYTCIAGPDLDLVSYAPDKSAVASIMRRYAFKTVVVERDNRVGTKEDALLRKYLEESGDYSLIAAYDLPVFDSLCNSLSVDVYTLRQPLERTVDTFHIPMPRTGSPIRVSLHEKTLFAHDRG